VAGRDTGGTAGPSTPGIRIPEGAGEGPGNAGAIPKTFTNFRPPPGFMDKTPDPSSVGLEGVDLSDPEVSGAAVESCAA
jgi:hypothetical protein